MNDNEKIRDAIATKRISSLTDQEISECVNHAWEMEKTGKSADPNDIELAKKYLREYHPGKGFREVWLAVELNLFGRLEIRIKTFQYFSVKYLSQIMDEYEKLRNQYFREQTKNAPQPEFKFSSGGEMYQTTLEFIEKHNVWPLIWPWWLVYEHLSTLGKVTEDQYTKSLNHVTATERSFRGESRKEFLLRMVNEAKKHLCKKVISNGRNIPEMEDFKINTI